MWLIFFFQQWQQELQQQRLIFHHFVISPRKPLRLLPCSDRLVYSCWGTIIRGISNTKDKWKRAETWMIWQFKEWKDKEKKYKKTGNLLPSVWWYKWMSHDSRHFSNRPRRMSLWHLANWPGNSFVAISKPKVVFLRRCDLTFPASAADFYPGECSDNL